MASMMSGNLNEVKKKIMQVFGEKHTFNRRKEEEDSGVESCFACPGNGKLTELGDKR